MTAPWLPGELALASGRRVRPFALAAADLDPFGAGADLGDVLARTLSKLPRFGGHHAGPAWSVAQHCVVMAAVVPGGVPEIRWALAHELFEGLTGLDVPAPLKAGWAAYRAAERRALRLFAETWGPAVEGPLGWPIPDRIAEADRRMAATEARVLGVPCDLGARPYDLGADDARPWPRDRAESEFAGAWRTLFTVRA